MVTLNEKNLEILVFPEREGVLSPIGHDLAIEAQRLTGSVNGDAVQVTVPVKELRVVGNVSHGRVDRSEPSPGDRKKIEANMLSDVLNAKKYPEISFSGTRTGDEVSGTLTICGASRPVSVKLVNRRGELTIRQTDFGITPYRAFLGQLRIKPELRIEIRELS